MRIEILVYTLIWVISYLVINKDYSKMVRSLSTPDQLGISRNSNRKIGFFGIIVIALLWVLFNVFITTSHPITSGDRMNYTVNFAGRRETPSIGLSWLISIVKMLGGDMNVLFYLTTFICMFITLIAYKYSVDATPKCMVLLFLTQYEYLTLTALKQCFTSAIASLVLVLLIQKHSRKTEVICLLLIIIACLFHPTGYILFPLYFAIKAIKKQNGLVIYIITIIVFAVCFQPLMQILGRTLFPLIPSLGTKVNQYFNESALEAGESLSISFLKGVPVYLITALAVYKRKTLANKVDNYDKYLIVTLTGAFLYMISIYSVWLYRFIYLFYLPIFIFYGKIISNLSIKSNRKIIDFVVYVGFAVVLYRFLWIVYK